MTYAAAGGKIYEGQDDADVRRQVAAAGGQGGVGDALWNAAYQQNNQQITNDELNGIAAANQAQSGVLNAGALAQTRRRAGGTTFRRRGSATSANQLVSGLGVANVKALADQRRKNSMNNFSIGVMGAGAPIGLWSAGPSGAAWV